MNRLMLYVTAGRKGKFSQQVELLQASVIANHINFSHLHQNLFNGPGGASRLASPDRKVSFSGAVQTKCSTCNKIRKGTDSDVLSGELHMSAATFFQLCSIDLDSIVNGQD